ncbi:MAG: hypothetical protein ACUVQO_20925 [Leptodesmis sp.]
MIGFMGFMGLLLLICLVNAIKFEWDHSEPDPLAQSKQTWRQRRDRAQHILNPTAQKPKAKALLGLYPLWA